MRSFSILLLSLFLTFSFVRPAQASSGAFKQNIATVIFCGLGGAVLGLSTLSFYGEPQEKIGNVYTGFALGLIGGSIYVATSGPSTRPSDSDDYSAFDKLKYQAPKQMPLIAQWQWQF